MVFFIYNFRIKKAPIDSKFHSMTLNKLFQYKGGKQFISTYQYIDIMFGVEVYTTRPIELTLVEIGMYNLKRC